MAAGPEAEQQLVARQVTVYVRPEQVDLPVEWTVVMFPGEAKMDVPEDSHMNSLPHGIAMLTISNSLQALVNMLNQSAMSAELDTASLGE